MLYSEIKTMSSRDLCFLLGNAISEDIKNKKIKKGEIAKKAGITPMSLYRLCKGENSSVETLFKVLKATGKLSAIDALITASPPDPMSFYKKFKKKKNKKISDEKTVTREDIKKIIEGDFEWNA